MNDPEQLHVPPTRSGSRKQLIVAGLLLAAAGLLAGYWAGRRTHRPESAGAAASGEPGTAAGSGPTLRRMVDVEGVVPALAVSDKRAIYQRVWAWQFKGGIPRVWVEYDPEQDLKSFAATLDRKAMEPWSPFDLKDGPVPAPRSVEGYFTLGVPNDGGGFTLHCAVTRWQYPDNTKGGWTGVSSGFWIPRPKSHLTDAERQTENDRTAGVGEVSGVGEDGHPWQIPIGTPVCLARCYRSQAGIKDPVRVMVLFESAGPQ